MEFVILICSLFSAGLGTVVGYAIGFYNHISKQTSEDNCIQIQTEEILLDAKTNKEIADITSSADDSPKNKIFAELTKKINAAAQRGSTRLYLEDEYAFNKKIRKYLSIEEIRKYFKNSGYEVKFCFSRLGYSDIEYIDWGE